MKRTVLVLGVAALAFGALGMAPTQKHFQVQHIHWYKVRDGKIVEHTANRDDIGMMRQLGLLPPAQAEPRR